MQNPQTPNPENPQVAGQLSQAIGSLMKTIGKNAPNSDSTPTPSTKNSEITTSPAGRSLKIGMPDSTPGLATLRNLASDKAADSETIDRSLVAFLKQVCGSQIALTDKFNSEYDIVGTDIVFAAPLSDELLTVVDRFTRPAQGGTVAAEITRLRTMTGRRQESGADLEMLIGAMTEELMEFPYDVVRNSCREWARKNIFFPTLKEIRDECVKAARVRLALRKALAKHGQCKEGATLLLDARNADRKRD
jgi:hypothetical protein